MEHEELGDACLRKYLKASEAREITGAGTYLNDRRIRSRS